MNHSIVTQIRLLAILFLLASITFSCGIDINPCREGRGNVVSEIRNVADFKGVELQIAGDVYLTRSNNYEVRVEAYESLQSHIRTEVRDSTLFISSYECLSNRQGKTRIYISLPALRLLNLKGSGDILGNDAFQSDLMRLELSGSGSINVNCNATVVQSLLTGSGNINVRGKTTNHNIAIIGSGSVNAYDLVSETCNARISGSGSCFVLVSNTLNVNISGSGSVRYKGRPVINRTISGSGSVSDGN